MKLSTFVPFLLLAATAGCDAPPTAIAESLAEARQLHGCFADVDPATYAAEATDLLRSAAEPDHPACAGDGAPLDAPVLCDALVEASVDEQGHSVKTSRATFAVPSDAPILRATELGDFSLAPRGTREVEIRCELKCSGMTCEQSGCFPNATGCGSWSCGPGCNGNCVQTVSLLPEKKPVHN